MTKFFCGFFLGLTVATCLGLDLKNYAPERGQRLVSILKEKNA